MLDDAWTGPDLALPLCLALTPIDRASVGLAALWYGAEVVLAYRAGWYRGPRRARLRGLLARWAFAQSAFQGRQGTGFPGSMAVRA